jgi:hypothetical protein
VGENSDRRCGTIMPNGSGMYRLIGVCSLLIAVIGLHIYTLLEEEATKRKIDKRNTLAPGTQETNGTSE